jgi:hypothetical protein
MIKGILVLFILIQMSSVLAVCQKGEKGWEIENLAAKNEVNGVDVNVIARQKLIADHNNRGVRVAYNGVKDQNTLHGLGGVNNVLDVYEAGICNHFEGDFKKQNPNIKVNIVKTDFKGLYVTCTPVGKCEDVVKKNMAKAPAPVFPEPAEDKIKEFKSKGKPLPVFSTTNVIADSYSEGYIKARAANEYGKESTNLLADINHEMSEGLKEATGGKDIAKTQKFKDELAKNIEYARSGAGNKVDPKFNRLISALDTMMETPFAAADDVEKELEAILEKPDGVYTAKTGDDLFVVIKEKGEVKKIIGADARGLGVMNMLTRLDDYTDMQASGKTKFNSLEEVFGSSLNAMKEADKYMDKSMDKYNTILLEELEKMKTDGRTYDQAIGEAHQRYIHETKLDPDLMEMRAGAIHNCGNEPKKIMNRVTVIHNKLKELEKAGIEGSFGTSCIGMEYLVRKAGLNTN